MEVGLKDSGLRPDPSLVAKMVDAVFDELDPQQKGSIDYSSFRLACAAHPSICLSLLESVFSWLPANWHRMTLGAAEEKEAQERERLEHEAQQEREENPDPSPALKTSATASALPNPAHDPRTCFESVVAVFGQVMHCFLSPVASLA